VEQRHIPAAIWRRQRVQKAAQRTGPLRELNLRLNIVVCMREVLEACT
jgi:hypothetical protein